LHAQIQSFAKIISDHPIEILPDVPQTLQYLSGATISSLMTKAQSWRQTESIERSD